ncbi:MAG: aminotransferase class I/II-fold pyridoxal phosphate-dependent enzyme [Ginsengibacter sp.]
MKAINAKTLHTSNVRDFFEKNPDFTPGQDQLLNYKWSRRWFDWLRACAGGDVYTFQEVMQGKSGSKVLINDSSFFMMSSYDYMGLIGHPEIEEAAIEAIKKYGTGSGGVRLLTGTNELHEQLETDISIFKGTEAAMVFSSGYMANMAVIAALFSKNDLIITDEYIHRSIADAIKLAGITPVSFRHNDAQSLKEILSNAPASVRKLIIVEGIYSMDGDICNLPDIVQMKEEYNALLMIDEAHSLGVLGEDGRGLNYHFNIPSEKIDIFTGSLSKAVPSNGGFIAAREKDIVYLKHGAAPFMFSAASTPANTAAAIAALRIFREENYRQDNLWKNSRLLINKLRSIGIDTGLSESPIVPVICGSNESAFCLSKKLFDEGYITTAVIYPAVPTGKARLRLCCTAALTVDLIDQFVCTLDRIYS